MMIIIADGREETLQVFLFFHIHFVIQFQQIIGNQIWDHI